MLQRFLATFALLSFLLPSLAHAASYGHFNSRPTERVSSRTLEGKTKRGMTQAHVRVSRTSVVAKRMKTYTNEKYKMSIGYPVEWSVVDNYMNTIVSFVSPLAGSADVLTENVNILVEDAEGNSLLSSTRSALAELNGLENFRLVSTMDTVIDKHPGKAIVYSAGRDPKLQFKQVWTIVNGKLYIFTFAAGSNAFRDYVKIFDKMVGTIVLH